VANGFDQVLGVVLVQAGDIVAEVDGDPAGDAGGEAEHTSFPAAAWQPAGVEGCYRGALPSR
jgi:hypothetical protein